MRCGKPEIAWDMGQVTWDNSHQDDVFFSLSYESIIFRPFIERAKQVSIACDK